MPGNNISVSTSHALQISTEPTVTLPVQRAENTPSNRKCAAVLKKVCRVAEIVFKALLQIAAGAFLFWLNPTCFAISFFAGIFFDDQVAKGIKKIKDVWQSQTIFTCAVGIAAGYLALPVVMAAASLLGGAHLGCQMSQKAQIKA